MKSAVRTLLCVLLSATMLAWGLAPPAIEHSHDGGDDPGHRHEEHHAGFHGSDHSHREAWSDSTSRYAAFGEAAHRHWRVFGFELTFPGEGSSTENGGDRGAPELLYLAAGRTPLPQLNGVPGPEKPPPLASFDAAPEAIAPLRPAASGSRAPVATQPLCDRARHARSGVLLA